MNVRWILATCGVLAGMVLAITHQPVFGAAPSGERLARMQRSEHYAAGHFKNLEPTHKLQPGKLGEMFWHQLTGDEQRVPLHPIPVVERRTSDYATPPQSGLRATWIGHATTLVEIDGRRVLFDPIFSERCSPFTFVGPKRFFPPPIALDDLPVIDAVVISHNHYDHLDMASITALAARGTQFYVPLGVGADLARWGVADKQIHDLDWNERQSLGGLSITCTPARHYSGRGLFDADSQLWASWVIAGPKHRVFFSGDSGYGSLFKTIGETYGPFDLTLIKIGASDPTWYQIHMAPEDAVRAHQDLRGRLLIPVHWGTFNLAYHAWNEPAERLVSAARAADVSYCVPRPGDWVEPGVHEPAENWWR